MAIPKIKSTGSTQSGPRTYAEIQADLKAPVADEFLAYRKQGGVTLTYIPWHKAAELGDSYAPGWQEKTITHDLGTALQIIRSIGIPTSDQGIVWRDGEGWEDKSTSGYGDPSSNAASMAFRRAWAKHGLGRYLYDKDGDTDTVPDRGIKMWFGDHRGKDYTDPSVPVRALQWAADHTEEDRYPGQKDKLIAEIAKRQGQIGGNGPTVAGKISVDEILALQKLGKNNGKDWDQIKAIAHRQFNQADPSKLGPEEFASLKVMVEAS